MAVCDAVLCCRQTEKEQKKTCAAAYCSHKTLAFNCAPTFCARTMAHALFHSFWSLFVFCFNSTLIEQKNETDFFLCVVRCQKILILIASVGLTGEHFCCSSSFYFWLAVRTLTRNSVSKLWIAINQEAMQHNKLAIEPREQWQLFGSLFLWEAFIDHLGQ